MQKAFEDACRLARTRDSTRLLLSEHLQSLRLLSEHGALLSTMDSLCKGTRPSFADDLLELVSVSCAGFRHVAHSPHPLLQASQRNLAALTRDNLKPYKKKELETDILL